MGILDAKVIVKKAFKSGFVKSISSNNADLDAGLKNTLKSVQQEQEQKKNERTDFDAHISFNDFQLDFDLERACIDGNAREVICKRLRQNKVRQICNLRFISLCAYKLKHTSELSQTL